MGRYNQGSPALGNVGSYQVSAKPFFKSGLVATNTVQVLEFPTVTSWIHIRNLHTLREADGPKISFSENGMDTNNYFVWIGSPVVNDTANQVLYLKMTKLYYKSATGGNTSFEVIAGLTGIHTGSILNNWAGTKGVG